MLKKAAAVQLRLTLYADLCQATVCTAAAATLHLLGMTLACVADYNNYSAQLQLALLTTSTTRYNSCSRRQHTDD
jgi:hypothetical protein